MLSKNQVKRLLAQCDKVDKAFRGNNHRLAVPIKLQKEQTRNEGWMEALTLVLGKDPALIRDKPLEEKE